MVVSTYHGFRLSTEYVLGTVKGSANTPVKEYWGIRLLERGTHVLRVSKSGRIEETRVELANDGIYLGSVEPEEINTSRNWYGTERILLDLVCLKRRADCSARGGPPRSTNRDFATSDRLTKQINDLGSAECCE